jgi:hypothetical protein
MINAVRPKQTRPRRLPSAEVPPRSAGSPPAWLPAAPPPHSSSRLREATEIGRARGQHGAYHPASSGRLCYLQLLGVVGWCYWGGGGVRGVGEVKRNAAVRRATGKALRCRHDTVRSLSLLSWLLICFSSSSLPTFLKYLNKLVPAEIATHTGIDESTEPRYTQKSMLLGTIN